MKVIALFFNSNGCNCIVCKSDLVNIVPCQKEEEDED